MGTYDASADTMTVYLDGTSANTCSNGSVATQDEPLALGRLGGKDKEYFSGQIDEARVYNRALGSGEVQDLYQSGYSQVNTSRKLSGISNLVGWWPLDSSDIDWSTDTANDRSGNGNDGTFNGGMTNADSAVTGWIGQALSFDGSDDHIHVGDTSVMDFGTGNFSYSVWVKTSQDCTGNKVYVGQRDGGGGARPSVWMGCNGNNHMQFDVDDSNDDEGAVESSTTINDGQWHHLVGVKEGHTNATVTAYLDGDKVDATDTSFSGNFDYSSDTYGFEIGKFVDNYYADAVIDDVRVYGQALSADDVSRIYNATRPDIINSSQNTQLTAGLQGMWSFDGADMDWTATDEARDGSGNGNHGNVQNFGKENTVIGQIGQALDFDGSSDYVDTGANEGITGEITISHWVNADSFGAHSFSGGYDGTKTAWEVKWMLDDWVGDSSSDLGIGSYDDPPHHKGVVDGDFFSTDQWYHVVGVYTGSTWKVYINGTDETDMTLHDGTGALNSSANRYIGAHESGGSTIKHFDGKIDDPRVYNRALSADEIQRLYNMGQ
jgi:hypothetical protein